jgi:presenilin-like A22 family membrane protease
MFLIAQFIGLYVSNTYLPQQQSIVNNETGQLENKSVYNLPYGFNPPEDVSPTASVISIMISILIAVGIIFLFMRFRAETLLRIWFTFVVMIGLALALNAFLSKIVIYSSALAILIALPLAILKIYRRSIIIHNITELLIYPGIAVIFIPLLNVWASVVLLILISLYDAYAVWHAGFMQKMAKYQIEKLRVFSGFFIPYVRSSSQVLPNAPKKLKNSKKDAKVQVAILGGGDVVFPIIVSGVVLRFVGLVPALFVTFGATLALATLFYFSEKGKFYPAMPFISVGCLLGIASGFLI